MKFIEKLRIWLFPLDCELIFWSLFICIFCPQNLLFLQWPEKQVKWGQARGWRKGGEGCVAWRREYSPCSCRVRGVYRQFRENRERDMRWGAIVKSKNKWQFWYSRIVAEVATHSTSFHSPKRGSWGLEQEEVFRLLDPFQVWSFHLRKWTITLLFFQQAAGVEWGGEGMR